MNANALSPSSSSDAYAYPDTPKPNANTRPYGDPSTHRDYQRLVARPNGGRTLWVLASGRPFHWERWIDEDLKRVLERSSRDRGASKLPDGSRILRIDLP